MMFARLARYQFEGLGDACKGIDRGVFQSQKKDADEDVSADLLHHHSSIPHSAG
jgi:hypothetical protein